MSFDSDVASFVSRAGFSLLGITQEVVTTIGIRLIERSPVGDTSYWKMKPPPGYIGGLFKGNWQYGFNEAPNTALDTIDASGEESLSRIESNDGAPGIHYITNCVPYAMDLENGYSPQAPAGIVGLTAIEFPDIVATVVKEHNA